MNTKKLIGFACWLIAFIIPAKWGLLETEHTLNQDGTTNNILGLAAFVAFVVLVFIGYILVDGAKSQKAEH